MRDWLIVGLLLVGGVCIAQDPEVVTEIAEIGVPGDVAVEASVEAVETTLSEWVAWGFAVVGGIVAAVSLFKRVGWKRAALILAEEIKDRASPDVKTPVAGESPEAIVRVGESMKRSIKRKVRPGGKVKKGLKVAARILDLVL